MIRKVISIDEELCNGCGVCISACHEGAIGLVGQKAVLLRDDYCDGLGDCLPACPTGAISFTEREAAAYDEVAVKAHQAKNRHPQSLSPEGCPGSMRYCTKEALLGRDPDATPQKQPASPIKKEHQTSALRQWPVEIKLVNVRAAFFAHASVLIAADCTAFAYANFHQDFMEGKITLIGCPKLDEGDYSEKLAEIFTHNNIASVTVVRMEVPCCRGIEQATRRALELSGKTIPLQVAILSTKGELL